MHSMRTLKPDGRQRLAVIVILCAAIWVIAPVMSQFGSALPVYRRTLDAVPLFNAWTVWWNADRAASGFDNYWQAPIFHPADDSFAYSEPQTATALVAPVIWLTGSPAAAYNTWILLGLFLNGFLTWRILRRHQVHPAIALAGAVSMTWLPVVTRQLEVLQLISVWPALWTWDAVWRHGRKPTVRTAVEVSISWAVGFHICVHHSLFVTILMGLTVWIVLTSWRSSRLYVTSVVTIAIMIVLVGGFAWKLRESHHRHGFRRTADRVARLSVKPRNLLYPVRDAWLRGVPKERPGHTPGWLKCGLALAAIAIGVRRRRHRRWILFLGATTVVAGVLAMGPHARLGPLVPWDWVARLPGIAQVRSVYRFTFFMQTAITLLAFTGLWWLYAWSTRRSNARACHALFGIIALVAILESPLPQRWAIRVPELKQDVGWAKFVQENTPDGKAIITLPFNQTLKPWDYRDTTRWMYRSTLHGVPLVNGYSGYVAWDVTRMQKAFVKDGLTAELLEKIREKGAHFIVVHASDRDSVPDNLMLPVVFSDSRVRIYLTKPQ